MWGVCGDGREDSNVRISMNEEENKSQNWRRKAGKESFLGNSIAMTEQKPEMDRPVASSIGLDETYVARAMAGVRGAWTSLAEVYPIPRPISPTMTTKSENQRTGREQITV